MGCQDNGCWQGRSECPTPEDCLGFVRRVKPYPCVPPMPNQIPSPLTVDWRDKLVVAVRCVLLFAFAGAMALALLSLAALIT